MVSPAFSTELTTGLTYDSHQETFPVGADFSLTETFEDESELSVSLDYKNAGAYTASIMYDRYFTNFLLSGGLSYDISTEGISPTIAAGTGLVLNKFSFLAGGNANLNADNIFLPTFYSCYADMIFDTPEAIIDLSFLYSSLSSSIHMTRKIGGGIVFTAYEEGVPASIDIIGEVLYVTDTKCDIKGIAATTGMCFNINLPVLTLHLKTLVDVKNPELPAGSGIPFSIGISAGFTL